MSPARCSSHMLLQGAEVEGFSSISTHEASHALQVSPCCCSQSARTAVQSVSRYISSNTASPSYSRRPSKAWIDTWNWWTTSSISQPGKAAWLWGNCHPFVARVPNTTRLLLLLLPPFFVLQAQATAEAAEAGAATAGGRPRQLQGVC